MKEAELFPYLKEYLESNNYTVRAEVKNCDITATRDDELVIIEIKTSINTTLLIQATDRQRVTDTVYVAVPKPSKHVSRKHWRGVQHLLRRLELGLILVNSKARLDKVKVVFHPIPFDKKKISKRKRSILKEIEGRSGNRNVGGITGTTLVTAYRENAIKLAVLLSNLGASKPKRLREFEGGEKTTAILSSNFYNWFERVDHGVYDVTAKGKDALKKYPELAKAFKKDYKKLARKKAAAEKKAQK